MVNPYVLCFWMRLDKETSTAEGLNISYDLPCMLRMTLWITAPGSDLSFSKMWCRCHRAVFWVYPVGTPAGMWFVSCFNLSHNLLFFIVHNHHLVPHVCGHLDISLAGIPSAVMQEPLTFYLSYAQIYYVRVVNDPEITCFL